MDEGIIVRVGYDVSPITKARSGVGNYTYFLLKHLMMGSENCEFRLFSSGRRMIDHEGLDRHVSHRHVPLPTRVLYRMWETLSWPNVDSLVGGCDVFHATNFFLPPTRKARTVVTIHDLGFLAVPQYSSPKIVKPFSKGINRFCRDADAIMVYSESTKRDILRFCDPDPEKIVIAPLAIDEQYHPVEREKAKEVVRTLHGIEDPYLLFVSTLEPRKNVVGLLESFAILAKDIPHKLVLIGALGWSSEEYFERIEKLGLGERVVHLGYVANDLLSFYSAADAFVFPTHYEGFGLPLLEAMTCGCPVVSSDNSSIEEVTGDGALLVNSHDIEGFADAVSKVLTDRAWRERLVTAGKAKAATFSWTRCAETTLEVYQRLAS